MSTFSYTPDFGAKATVRANVIETQYGDGYSQRQSIGMNPVAKDWDLTFSNRSAADAAAIDAFLSALYGATSFDWTPPTGSAGKYVCKSGDWDIVTVKYNLYTVTAKFTQVFEP